MKATIEQLGTEMFIIRDVDNGVDLDYSLTEKGAREKFITFYSAKYELV